MSRNEIMAICIILTNILAKVYSHYGYNEGSNQQQSGGYGQRKTFRYVDANTALIPEQQDEFPSSGPGTRFPGNLERDLDTWSPVESRDMTEGVPIDTPGVSVTDLIVVGGSNFSGSVPGNTRIFNELLHEPIMTSSSVQKIRDAEFVRAFGDSRFMRRFQPVPTTLSEHISNSDPWPILPEELQELPVVPKSTISKPRSKQDVPLVTSTLDLPQKKHKTSVIVNNPILPRNVMSPLSEGHFPVELPQPFHNDGPYGNSYTGYRKRLRSYGG